LGQWLQAPFHHHWRQRLGLGYGVFAGHRRLAGLDGLLFAVQSPYADAHTLLGHVQAFICLLYTSDAADDASSV
ncbi:hypothetical protein, partial [Pseudomonas paraeruginosa]|uniref:hypothetical protein n=1 Tax=Pseudomonas paraeruginosa TaxID=2994495 RepID=UPI003A4C612A